MLPRPVSTSSTSSVRVLLYFNLISKRQSSGISLLAGSCSLVSFTSHSGPQCHNLFVESSSGVKPLDGMSAGFSTPAQCLQQVTGTSSRISVAWLWTNCSNTEPLESLCSRLVDHKREVGGKTFSNTSN